MAACLDMTIGTRLHFTIDAVCAGVPSLLISHDGDFRCHGIIGSMLEMQDHVYNIDHIDTESLIKSVTDLWQKREAVRAHLLERMKSIQKETYRHGEVALALYEQHHSQ